LHTWLTIPFDLRVPPPATATPETKGPRRQTYGPARQMRQRDAGIVLRIARPVLAAVVEVLGYWYRPARVR